MRNFRSSSGWWYRMAGSSCLPLGRAKRPEWVSWRPMSRSSVRPCAAACSATSASRRAASADRFASLISNWFGFARPSCRTATASPPKMSFAPLCPKRRHRRSVSSDGAPSGVPSHPSIGSTANRLPTVNPFGSRYGCARGAWGPVSSVSSKGMSMPSFARYSASSADRRSCATRRYAMCVSLYSRRRWKPPSTLMTSPVEKSR